MSMSKKAVSTLILIILILCATVFGALISYLWVMANYYNMPENMTMLVVENAVFPESPNLDFTYFNVTILNPSNSVSDVNITAVRLTVEGKNYVYDITTTEPEQLPFTIKRGTRQTFKCLKNWSTFAGETVRIEPVAANISALSYSCQTPNATLELQPNFDVEESVEYFNLTVKNSGNFNLTLSDILVIGESISNNVTPSLTTPYILSPGQNVTFKCDWNWDWGVIGIRNITVTVKTTEGYEITYTTNELPGAKLYIDNVAFDYSNPSYFNLTIRSLESSTSIIYLDRINLTLTGFPPITLTTVPLSQLIFISPNTSLTIRCLWNWTDHRNETITISVYARQGFTAPSWTGTTPTEVVWNVTEANFDLDNTDFFLVSVKNMACSLRNVTVNQILLNWTNIDGIEPATLSSGEETTFNCLISWREYIGNTANITVVTTEGSISQLIQIPAVQLKIIEERLVFGDFYDNATSIAIPYINITVSNSNNSLYNVTLVRIILQTRNDIYIIYDNATYRQNNNVLYPKLRPEEHGPKGYPLKIGENVTFVCSWNYESYLTTEPIMVTIYTAESFQVSVTWYP